MHRVNPCACGICGAPVVRVPEGEKTNDGWTVYTAYRWEDADEGWGHYYVNGKLVRVRCWAHSERV